jgi:hypothetical protein
VNHDIRHWCGRCSIHRALSQGVEKVTPLWRSLSLLVLFERQSRAETNVILQGFSSQ